MYLLIQASLRHRATSTTHFERLEQVIVSHHSMDERRNLRPLPPVGIDKEFDAYVKRTFGDVDHATADLQELRRAAWATWKTSAPSTRQPSAEDDDLAKAIALSVQEQHQGSSSRPIVIDDDDDDEIQLVLAMSAAEAEEQERKKQEQQEAPTDDEEDTEQDKPKDSAEDHKPDNAASTSSAAPGPVSSGLRLGLASIDRAQLEKERLARQAARSGHASTHTPSASTSDTVNVKRASATASKRDTGHPLQSSGPSPRDAAGEYYLDGELRHTKLRIGEASSDRTFTAQDVFESPSQMSLIIVSSFVWDLDWLSTLLPDPALVPTIRVMRPSTSSFTEMRSLQGKLQPMPDGAIHVYPDMSGKGGSEHMKYAWIFYKTGRLRVAIMTANLVPYDYQDIENTIFIQDFLKQGRTLESKSSETSTSLPDFPDQFRRLFSHLKIHKALRFLTSGHPEGQSMPISSDQSFADFGQYDWSRVQVRLVMSIPGVYNGLSKMATSGIGRLATVLEEEGWKPQPGDRVVAEYQGSSLGGYYIDWFNRFYQAASGMSLATMSRQPKPLSWPPIKVMFPSLATVDASVLGRPGGGTMFCGKSFARVPELFYDANSKRGGVLMHSKILVAMFEKETSAVAKQAVKRKADVLDEDSDSGVGGWVYVGSHNFTPSAWGTLNFKNSPATLNISNYELGIVFPLPRVETSTVVDRIVTYKRPPRPYGGRDEPWSQDKHMNV